MYPVISLLRRAAASVVYVRPEMLVKAKKGLVYPMARKNLVLDVRQRCWISQREIPFFLLTSPGPTPEGRAIGLSDAESKLAKELRLLEKPFTLFVGEETESDEMRRLPLGIVQGVHRLNGVVRRIKTMGTVTFQALPPGVTHERR